MSQNPDPQQSWMRRWPPFVHRWLDLRLGIIFAIASPIGGILVYEAPLDE